MGSLISLILGVISQPIASIFSGFFSAESVRYRAEAAVADTAIKASAEVQTRWWFVAAMVSLFAMIFVIYDAKAVVWDNVIMGGHSRTPALKGDLSFVHLTVVAGLFFHALVSRIK